MSATLNMIREHAEEGAKLRLAFFENNAGRIDELALALARCLADGGKILICGNGGSAADAQHMSGELLGRFVMERPSLPAVALSVDTSTLTAVGNDYGFDDVFARQVNGLGRAGDALVVFSTSGKPEYYSRARSGSESRSPDGGADRQGRRSDASAVRFYAGRSFDENSSDSGDS